MKHWIFDLDGTLVDSFSIYFDFLDATFREHGVELPHVDRELSISMSPMDFLGPRIGRDKAAPAVAHLMKTSFEDSKKIKPFPGIPELLEDLTARGHSVSVWTNRDRETTQWVLDFTGLSKHSSILVSRDCVAKPKPDPAGLYKLIAHYGAKPEDFVMVGDHVTDMIAGKSGGAQAVRASWHAHWEHGPCEVAHQQFRSPAELREWLRTYRS